MSAPPHPPCAVRGNCRETQSHKQMSTGTRHNKPNHTPNKPLSWHRPPAKQLFENGSTEPPNDSEAIPVRENNCAISASFLSTRNCKRPIHEQLLFRNASSTKTSRIMDCERGARKESVRPWGLDRLRWPLPPSRISRQIAGLPIGITIGTDLMRSKTKFLQNRVRPQMSTRPRQR